MMRIVIIAITATTDAIDIERTNGNRRADELKVIIPIFGS